MDRRESGIEAREHGRESARHDPATDERPQDAIDRSEALHVGAHPDERAPAAAARLELPRDDRARAHTDLGRAGDARGRVELEQPRARRAPQSERAVQADPAAAGGSVVDAIERTHLDPVGSQRPVVLEVGEEGEDGVGRGGDLALGVNPHTGGMITAEPSRRPWRRSSRAVLAFSRAYWVTVVRTGTWGARFRNSIPSCRVRLATDRIVRSSQSSEYGNPGMSLMWIPAHTTTPPRSRARRAAGTSGPTGAKMIAASSGSGGASSDPPAHSAPNDRAKACVSASPGDVKANTRRPCHAATWAMMWADEPNP